MDPTFLILTPFKETRLVILSTGNEDAITRDIEQSDTENSSTLKSVLPESMLSSDADDVAFVAAVVAVAFSTMTRDICRRGTLCTPARDRMRSCAVDVAATTRMFVAKMSESCMVEKLETAPPT